MNISVINLSGKSFKLIFLIILSALVLTSCAIKDPYFKKPDNVVVVSLSPNKIELSADLILHNPNKISFTLKEIDIDIFTKNEVKLTKFRQTFNVGMPSKSDFVVPVRLTFDPKKLFSDSGGILGSALSAIRSQEIEIIYKGTSKVEKLGIAISIPVESAATFKLEN